MRWRANQRIRRGLRCVAGAFFRAKLVEIIAEPAESSLLNCLAKRVLKHKATWPVLASRQLSQPHRRQDAVAI
jgi:hypothetical protein